MCSLDCDDSVATVECVGDTVELRAVRDRNLVGRIITLTVVDDENGVEAIDSYRIRGWV